MTNDYPEEGKKLIRILECDNDPVNWEMAAWKLGNIRYQPALEPLI